MKKCLFIYLLCFFSLEVFAIDIRQIKDANKEVQVDVPQFLIQHDHPFYGLAAIYNHVQAIYIEDSEVFYLPPEGIKEVPASAEWFGYKSRYQVAMIKNMNGLKAEFSDNKLNIKGASRQNFITFIGYPQKNPELKGIKYSHLWSWLAALTKGIEWLLDSINQWLDNWGLSIIILSVLMKFLLMPVSFMTLRLQRQVNRYQTLLEPDLAEIKKNHKGETAHNRMMAAHKKHGITPFYALKPLFSNLIQIPVLVAIFNALGEMSQLQGQAFMWITDLSVPDRLFSLGFSVPLLGTGFNMLPIVMTVITVASTIFYKNSLAPANETSRQKRNLYFMAFGFLVLFYPFPAAMVLYWAMANLLQFVLQKFTGN